MSDVATIQQPCTAAKPGIPDYLTVEEIAAKIKATRAFVYKEIEAGPSRVRSVRHTGPRVAGAIRPLPEPPEAIPESRLKQNPRRLGRGLLSSCPVARTFTLESAVKYLPKNPPVFKPNLRHPLPPVRVRPALMGARWNRRAKHRACQWSSAR